MSEIVIGFVGGAKLSSTYFRIRFRELYPTALPEFALAAPVSLIFATKVIIRGSVKLAAMGAFFLAAVAPTGEYADAADIKDRLVVVVNISNPVTHIERVDLHDIYLGKRRVWATGGVIMTCDLAEVFLSEKMTARAKFAKEYLNKDLRSLKSYWIKMIFSGRGQPPTAFKRTEEVIGFVSANKSAIGYLYESQVTGAVKVIPVTSEKNRP